MTLTYQINKSAEYIFAALTDMDRFAELHPVITKATLLEPGHYKIFETLSVGFIPVSFSYLAEVKSHHAEKEVNMSVRLKKLATIEIFFSVTEIKGISHVTEEIIFKSILPVKAIMQQIFKKQHAVLFHNIERSIG